MHAILWVLFYIHADLCMRNTQLKWKKHGVMYKEILSDTDTGRTLVIRIGHVEVLENAWYRHYSGANVFKIRMYLLTVYNVPFSPEESLKTPLNLLECLLVLTGSFVWDIVTRSLLYSWFFWRPRVLGTAALPPHESTVTCIQIK